MHNMWKCDYKLLKAQKRSVNGSHPENAVGWNPSPKLLNWDVVEHDVLLFTLSCNLIRRNIFTNILHAFDTTMYIVITRLFNYHCNAVTLSTDISKPAVKIHLIVLPQLEGVHINFC